MPFENQTICKPDNFWPFKYETSPVFRWLLFNKNGSVLNFQFFLQEGEAEGYIAFKKPWPGIMRTVYGNHARFEQTYFSRFPGYYMSGDGAKRDADGYIWITGRIDDMLNSSGTVTIWIPKTFKNWMF